MTPLRAVLSFADGSYVRPDRLTPWWTSHPRLGWVLKDGDGLAVQYRTRAAAVAALAEHGYAKGEPCERS